MGMNMEYPERTHIDMGENLHQNPDSNPEPYCCEAIVP